MNILILGASGMIGSAIFRALGVVKEWQVHGTFRTVRTLQYFNTDQAKHLHLLNDLPKRDTLVRLLGRLQPDVVINCVGLTKHHQESADPLSSIPLNALLPHILADLCALIGARLLHVSTDCVFSGRTGGYREQDAPDALDLYGRSKILGEVDYPHAVNLRTSTIGHELGSAYGLLEWFLSQAGTCQGYSKAIFSGLTNTEFAGVIRDFVIPQTELHGLYHVGGEAIDKFGLLMEIAAVYGKSIKIEKNNQIAIDRSLNSERFYKATGYCPPGWQVMIRAMQEDRVKNVRR